MCTFFCLRLLFFFLYACVCVCVLHGPWARREKETQRLGSGGPTRGWGGRAAVGSSDTCGLSVSFFPPLSLAASRRGIDEGLERREKAPNRWELREAAAGSFVNFCLFLHYGPCEGRLRVLAAWIDPLCRFCSVFDFLLGFFVLFCFNFGKARDCIWGPGSFSCSNRCLAISSEAEIRGAWRGKKKEGAIHCIVAFKKTFLKDCVWVGVSICSQQNKLI